MDIYRDCTETFATLSLSNHDVEKLIDALGLDANVFVITNEYFLDDTGCPNPAFPRKNEIRYLTRNYYRVPFHKEVYMSKVCSGIYFVISRCVGTNKWSSHTIFFGDSIDLVGEYEQVFYRMFYM